MKRKIAFILFILSFGLAYGQTDFSNQWKKINEYENLSLPKSALEEVEAIFNQAKKEGNGPELIKALIYRLKYTSVIDQDLIPDKILETESFLAETTDPVIQSILYYVTAKLYHDYYTNDAWNISRRTALTEAPSDIREWSENLFVRKITDYYLLAVSNQEALVVIPTGNYAAIMTEGEDTGRLRPTMYDFLMYEVIDQLRDLSYRQYSFSKHYPQSRLSDKAYFASSERFVKLEIPSSEASYDLSLIILKLYQTFLDYRLQVAVAFFAPRHPDSTGKAPVDRSVEATTLLDLRRLNFVYETFVDVGKDSYYLAALQNLKEKHEGEGFCVEIIYLEAQHYLNNYAVPYDEENYAEREKQQLENKKKAFDLCNEGIERYPWYDRINILKSFLENMTQPQLRTNTKNVVYPGKNLELNISYQNINQIKVEIYKINEPVTVYKSQWNRHGKYIDSGSLVGTSVFELKNDLPYQSCDTMLYIPMNELGCYEYVITTDRIEEKANQQFSVSRLATVSRTIENEREYLVVDRISGKPIEGASVNFYNKDGLISSVITNKNGLARSSADDNVSYYNATYKDDQNLIFSSPPWIGTYNQTSDSNVEKLHLFSDRSIYRPGQTIFFKGIATRNIDLQDEVVPNKKYTISFLDTNRKEIAKKEVITNEYGSFAGEFVIPTGLANGYFTISPNPREAFLNIRVEEYKRPTFGIQFTPIETSYQFGDKISVSGEAKTFSGISLQDAEVKYKISRSRGLYRTWNNREEITEGTSTTNEDGKFTIDFVAERPTLKSHNPNTYYSYTIEATITDSNGETQSSTSYIYVGNKSILLSFSIAKEYIKSIDEIKIEAINFNGKLFETQGGFEIYKLTTNDKVGTKSFHWTEGEQVTSSTFQSGGNLDTKKVLASGKYRIKAKVKDEQGREVTATQDFVIASAKDKQPPIPIYQWIIESKTTVEAGSKAEIIYGSSAKDVHVLYEIIKDNKRLSISRFTLNTENKKIEIPFLESYGDGIIVQFLFVKDEQVFSRSIPIYRKKEDKSLNLVMETFRDRLLPGQQEEWKLSIKDFEKNPVLAEVLAGMYDASLDKIIKHSWQFSPLRNISLRPISNRNGTDFSTSPTNIYGSYKDLEIPHYRISHFNWFDYSYSARSGMLRSQAQFDSSSISASLEGRPAGVDVVHNKVIVQSEPEKVFVVGAAKLSDEDANRVVVTGMSKKSNSYEEAESEPATGGTAEVVQIRQNFNETAFFYPQLKTNEEGETLISFVVPESNTTWKLMALAHTKDVKYGLLIKEAISQKKLMVTPNIPRFIRVGDQVTITTNISNLSDESLSGTVSISFFDPNTEKETIIVGNAKQSFSLEAGKTSPASWNFRVPEGLEMTAVKIVAITPTYSDGEQHLLPVLPNRMLVTESLPMSIKGNQTKTFSLDKLKNNSSSTLENYRMTLEFTANPIWYAVQALPSMQTPQSENVVSWLNAYYANSVAASIANSTPKLKQVIEQWTKQAGTKETLLSNLEKNEELKAILLEETPWVMTAESETEKKQRLSLLFDINRNNNLNQTAISKLKDLQLEDGGWAWFKGMGSSQSITSYIAYSLGNMVQEGIITDDSQIKEMQEKAISFLDDRVSRIFEEEKRNNKKWKDAKSVSPFILEYLYARSFYPDYPLGEVKEAANFYLSVVSKHWTKNTNLYNRSLMAIILHRKGETKTAQAILRSLREHATTKEDMGMYWANNNVYTFMSQSATIAHTFVMEAFAEIGTSESEMNEMKLWLLKQKQTQVWESTPATAAAISILLKTGSNWLGESGNLTIQLGNQSISTEQAEIGTGYIKEVFPAEAITTDMANVTVSKTSDEPAWGALYWQYFEDLDKITSSHAGLSVEKTIIPPHAGSLRVGDKVMIRLTVRADRDMEYVALKDMRAGCFEPTVQVSGVRWQNQVLFYQSNKDASTNFYFHSLPKGTYVFEYPVYVNRSGEYSTGTATIQCLYAPEFVSHSAGSRITVGEQ